MALKYRTPTNAIIAAPLLVAVVLVGACSSRGAPAAPPQRPHVSVATPIVREVIDWDDYVGRFEAVQDVTVMPRISGTITEILFKNGQDVKAGQSLFIIDPRPFRAVYLQAVAALAKTQATRANAKTVFERAQKLLSAQVLSKEDYDSREAALHSADADVEAQMAAVESARLNLEFTTVVAPVTGRVSDRKVSVGDTVVANMTPLTRVVTLDPIWFDFEGAESFYLKYIRQDKLGERRSSRYVPNPVEVQLADETGYPHKGRMVFVDNAIDTRSGTIRAQAELPNPDGFLTPGMFGRARLLGSGAYEAMLIPDEAIVTDQTRRLVYVVGEDGVVAARIVETGPLVVGLRVVRTGIVATDKVVLDGLARLQPGARVEATLEKLEPRAEDTSPTSAPLSATPSTQATPR
jgi:RND family efflux transporter MFP subunit